MELKAKVTKLKSGLRVVSVPMPVESVTVIAMVGVGSRYEEKKVGGVSHFIEHFMSNGTKKYKDKQDIWLATEEVGGVRNAFTSKEVTAYWSQVAKEHLELATDICGELVCRPLFPKKYLEKERGIILEELKMYEDKPETVAAQNFDKLLFGDTGLGRDIIGTRKSLHEMNIEKMKGFWADWYVPETTVVGVAGGIKSHKGFVELVEKKFAELSKTSKKKPQVVLGDYSHKKSQVCLVNKKTEQAHLVLGTGGLKRGAKERYAMSVMNSVLGGMATSRCFQKIREEMGLCYYIRSGADAYAETGSWGVEAGVKKEDTERAIRAILKEMRDFTGKRKPTKAEVERAKTNMVGNIKLKMESSSNEIGRVVSNLILEDRVRSYEEIFKGIEAVKVGDVVKVAEEVFKNGLNLSVVGPFEDKERFEKLLK
jgi:predicted Zn-dependent peptidase